MQNDAFNYQHLSYVNRFRKHLWDGMFVTSVQLANCRPGDINEQGIEIQLGIIYMKFLQHAVINPFLENGGRWEFVM